MKLVGIILLLLLLSTTIECRTPGARKMLAISEPEREIPSGPSDPEQYRMNHKPSGACGRDNHSTSSAPSPVAEATPDALHPNRDVPNGPDDPYSHVKEMSSCWKPHP